MTKLLVTILIIVVGLFVLNWSKRLTRKYSGGAAFIPPRGEGTDADVERLLLHGRKMSAIKLYREIHGVGLKEAKEEVDELARRHVDR